MPDDLVACFIERAQQMATTVDTVDALADVPAAAHRYLTQLGLPVQAIAWQTLQDLSWAEAGIEVEFRKPEDLDRVGITGCFCATAETGTLVLLSGRKRMCRPVCCRRRISRSCRHRGSSRSRRGLQPDPRGAR